jgi:hypothetical protein
MSNRETWNRNAAAGALCAVLALAPLAAEAQSYRCIDKEGRKIYGQVIPTGCYGVVVEQLSPQGIVVRRIEPPPTPRQIADTAAEEQKRRDDAEAAKIQARLDNALLATYPSIGSIDEARGRALRQATATVTDLEAGIEQLRQRETALNKELATYKSGRKPPAKLVDDLHQVELDLAAQAALLAAKQKDIEAINARYDEDKKRYADLSARRR